MEKVGADEWHDDGDGMCVCVCVYGENKKILPRKGQTGAEKGTISCDAVEFRERKQPEKRGALNNQFRCSLQYRRKFPPYVRL